MPLVLLKDGRYRLRIYADGKKTGRRIQETLPYGTTEQEARAHYLRKVAEAAGRKSGSRPAPEHWTIGFLLENYVDSNAHRLSEGTLATYRATIAQLKPALGSIRLDRLRPTDVQAYQRARKQAGAAAPTVNREVTFLKAALSWTVTQGWLPTSPLPARSVPRLPAPESRTRFFSREEWDRFLRAQEAPDFDRLSFQLRRRIPHFLPFWQFLLMTGTRLGEALALQWKDVDLEAGRVSIVQEKTGRLKELPVSTALRPVLEALPKGTPAAPIFADFDGAPITANCAWRVFTVARDLAGLPEDLVIHSLRHTFASWLASEGASLPVIGSLLGHSKPSMTARYAHLTDGARKNAVELVSKVLSEPPAPPERPRSATSSPIRFKR